MSRSILLACTALTALLAAPGPLRAQSVELSAGLDARATSWEGDASGRGSLRVAYRFTEALSAYFLGGLGYGAVDERVLQTIDLGGEVRGRLGWAAPFFRLGLVHQHESPRAAVEATPVSTLGGWGDGIRHRGGLSAGTGLSVPLGSRGGAAWFLLMESTGTLFVASNDGPSWSVGGGAALGASFGLGSSGDR